MPTFCIWVGVVLFAAGLIIRWWAIITLGRFFTVDVQIQPDHQIIESGPFRLLRHPSYAGVLLAFLGFGLSLANWLAFLVLMLPIIAVFLHRMNVEEEALTKALGKAYAAYRNRTSRLIPGGIEYTAADGKRSTAVSTEFAASCYKYHKPELVPGQSHFGVRGGAVPPGAAPALTSHQ